MHSEIIHWKEDAELIKRLGDFPNIPLIAIGRDKEYSIIAGIDEGYPEWELRKYEDKWQELIINQADMSSNSQLVFAENASHLIYLDRPDVILKSIRSLD